MLIRTEARFSLSNKKSVESMLIVTELVVKRRFCDDHQRLSMISVRSSAYQHVQLKGQGGGYAEKSDGPSW